MAKDVIVGSKKYPKISAFSQVSLATLSDSVTVNPDGLFTAYDNRVRLDDFLLTQ